MEAQAKFEGWAVLEIMGHNIEIGFVTTEYFGGPALFRVDRPSFEDREHTLTKPEWIDGKWCGVGSVVMRKGSEGNTVYVGPSSIFRMRPCTEEAARVAIENAFPAPIKILMLAEAKRLQSSNDDYVDAEEVR